MNSGKFNPDTLEIRWETPYEQAHEWAHVEQQVRQSLPWRAREASIGIPIVERVANLAVEFEAAWMARRELQACGIWTRGDALEAFAGLFSYALSLFSERLLRKALPTLFKSQIAPVETQANAQSGTPL